MEPTNLITEAFNLTLFGMGFVFVFLTLLVLVTKLMSAVLHTPNAHLLNSQADGVFDGTNHGIDEETQFVIEQAIKMHRGA